MELTKDQKNSIENVTDVIEKCWADASFKKQLVASPAKTLESFFGRPVNSKGGVKLIVNDQTNPSEMHINIPPNPRVSDMELSDAELEAVAGGGWGIKVTATTLCFNRD